MDTCHLTCIIINTGVRTAITYLVVTRHPSTLTEFYDVDTVPQTHFHRAGRPFARNARFMIEPPESLGF